MQLVFCFTWQEHEFFSPHLRDGLRGRDQALTELFREKAAGRLLSDFPDLNVIFDGDIFLEPRLYRALSRRGIVDESRLIDFLKEGFFRGAVFSRLRAARPGRIPGAVDKRLGRFCLREAERYFRGPLRFQLRRPGEISEEILIFFRPGGGPF